MSEDVISEEEPEDVYADFIDEESQRVKEVGEHARTSGPCTADDSQSAKASNMPCPELFQSLFEGYRASH